MTIFWFCFIKGNWTDILVMGDKLITKKEHARAALQIIQILLPRIGNSRKKFIITIGRRHLAFYRCFIHEN